MDNVLEIEQLTVPLLTGAYSVIGLYLGRAASNSTSSIGLGQVLLVGGTSAVAAAVSPMMSKILISPQSPIAPLLDAGLSSAMTWGALRLERVDADSAAMFVPVTLASYLLARVVKDAMWPLNKQQTMSDRLTRREQARLLLHQENNK